MSHPYEPDDREREARKASHEWELHDRELALEDEARHNPEHWSTRAARKAADPAVAGPAREAPSSDQPRVRVSQTDP